jgi:N-dimethylarginine dimethylaminohydrolase
MTSRMHFLSSATPVLLMCSPDFYKISPPDPEHGYANDFAIKGYELFIKDTKGFRSNARKQWSNLKSVFEAAGARIILVKPNELADDAVFTADPSLSLITHNDGVASSISIFSHFSNEPRQREVAISSETIEAYEPSRSFIMSYYRTEGTGDNVYDPYRDCFWSGYVSNAGRATAAAGRSDIRSHAMLTKLTGVSVISMAVKQPYFHIDTSMAPLPGGHIVCYPDGMKAEAYERILKQGLDQYGLKHDDFLIKVSDEDANRYACNLRVIGKTVIIPECSQELQDRIKKAGYDVVTVPMTYFMATGGAPHCLSNNINETRVVGGYASKLGLG